VTDVWRCDAGDCGECPACRAVIEVVSVKVGARKPPKAPKASRTLGPYRDVVHEAEVRREWDNTHPDGAPFPDDVPDAPAAACAATVAARFPLGTWVRRIASEGDCTSIPVGTIGQVGAITTKELDPAWAPGLVRLRVGDGVSFGALDPEQLEVIEPPRTP
jgi:hypothetical protein